MEGKMKEDRGSNIGNGGKDRGMERGTVRGTAKGTDRGKDSWIRCRQLAARISVGKI
jgi:hypothetical protein